MASADMTGQDLVAATILQSKLEALVAEMEATLINTAYSASISAWRRCGAAVFTEQGRLLAVSDPAYMYPLAETVATIIDKYQFDLSSEDVLLSNDPYGGGTQVQTFTLVAPVSDGDSIVMYVAVCGHTEDFGGDVRGNYNPTATEIWAEGARCTPVRLVREGKTRKDILKTLALNSRSPLAFELDVQALVAAAEVGKRRAGDLLRTLGTPKVVALADTVLEYSERRMRALIGRIPAGRYEGSARLQHDGHGRRDLTVRVVLVVKDRDLTFDFSGTDLQSAGFVNASRTATQSFAFLPLITAFGGEVPCNEGAQRALTFVLKEGTLVHPKFAAPTAWGMQHVGSEVSHAVVQALTQALPETSGRVVGNALLLFSIHRLARHGNTLEQAELFDFSGFAQSGADGSAVCDGWGAPGISSRVPLPSVELFEAERGGRVRSFELATDSAGPGEHRGSPAVAAVLELPEPAVGSLHLTAVIVQSRPHDATSAAGAVMLESDATTIPIGEALVNHPLRARSTLTIQAEGGRGWGSAYRRSIDKVGQDVADGLISAEAAHTHYGVVIDPATLVIDTEATRQRRAAQSV